jgi:hypothetical protein
MKAMTYGDWVLAGYQVKRGERSTGTDKDGHATFTREQVDNREERRKQDDCDDE